MSRVRRIRGLRIGIFMVISNSLYPVYATVFCRKTEMIFALFRSFTVYHNQTEKALQTDSRSQTSDRIPHSFTGKLSKLFKSMTLSSIISHFSFPSETMSAPGNAFHSKASMPLISFGYSSRSSP